MKQRYGAISQYPNILVIILLIILQLTVNKYNVIEI